MKKNLLLLSVLISGIGFSQNGNNTQQNSNTPVTFLSLNEGQWTELKFDADKALLEAKAKGIQPADYAGYVEMKRREWMKENGLSFQNTNSSNAKVIAPVSAQSGTNPDFETGDYTGWQLFSGENTLNSYGPLQNILPNTNGPNDSIYGSFNNNCNLSNINERLGIISATVGNDPVGGFPLASPMGGNYVARLNRFCTSYEGSLIQQNFAVTPGQTFLNYAYAVVLEDGGHAPGEQTYYTSYVLDANGDTIPGTYVYMQAANGLTPGFYPSLNPNMYSTYYKPWTPVSIDLSAYVGQNVTMVFIAADCIYAGHSGYAYVDARLDSVAGPGAVWPGDCNYDLTADMNDLLYIGWGYGATGATRPAATTTWQAEPMANWAQITPYGTDLKHADTNGDGVVDINDTLALSANYALSHTYKYGNSGIQPNAFRNLSLTANPSTVGPNQAFTIDVDLSSSGNVNADSLYGIAFRIMVPNTYVGSMTSTDYSASYLGVNNTTMLTIAKPFISNGNADVCLVRNSHTNSFGSGNLVKLNFMANGFTGGGTGNFFITDLTAITNGGAFLPLGAGNVNVNFSTTASVAPQTNNQLKLMPNPANENLYVSGLNGNNVRYEIINLLGETVANATINGKSPINVSSLTHGNYFIRLYTADGIVTRKFVKE